MTEVTECPRDPQNTLLRTSSEPSSWSSTIFRPAYVKRHPLHLPLPETQGGHCIRSARLGGIAGPKFICKLHKFKDRIRTPVFLHPIKSKAICRTLRARSVCCVQNAKFGERNVLQLESWAIHFLIVLDRLLWTIDLER